MVRHSAGMLVGLTLCACGGGASQPTGDAGPRGGGDGATASAVLWTAPSLGTVDAVALDATTVYFAFHDSTQAEIVAVPKSGGAPTTLYQFPSGGYATGLAIDAAHIYYSANAVSSLPLAGGTPTPLTTITTTVGPLAVDAQDVYFIDTSTDRLARAPIGGGASTDVAMSITGFYWLGASSATLVATPRNPGDPTPIINQPLDGSQPLQLDAFPAGVLPVGIYADSTTAFVSIDDHSNAMFAGYVEAMPLAGGTGGDTIYVAQLSAQGQDTRPQISGLIGDGTDLYLFSNYTGVNDVAADLVAVPEVKGGAPVTLVAQQSTPMYVAGVDSGFVYYVARKGPHDVEELRRVALR